MRIDAIGLRTWWLGGIAAWALLVWIMTLAGLGGRIEPLPDDPALVQRLPALPPPARERLQDPSRYSEIAARPLMAEDRRPHPFFLGGNEAEAPASVLRLTGVLITPQLKMATLTTEQGQSIRLRLQGDSVGGWRLLALEPRGATIEGPGGVQTLELRVFDGNGGEPPTVLAGAAPARADAARPAPGNAPAPAAPGNGNPPRTPPAPPHTPAAPAASAAAAAPTEEQQIRAIRERIEARRRQLQQQNQNQNGTTPGNKP